MVGGDGDRYSSMMAGRQIIWLNVIYTEMGSRRRRKREAKKVQKDRGVIGILKMQKQFHRWVRTFQQGRTALDTMETVLCVFEKPWKNQHRYSLVWDGVGSRPPGPKWKGKQHPDEQWRFKTILRITELMKWTTEGRKRCTGYLRAATKPPWINGSKPAPVTTAPFGAFDKFSYPTQGLLDGKL